MKQIKLFCGDPNSFRLEANVNSWISKNTKVKIIDVKFSTPVLAGGLVSHTVMVIYELTEDTHAQ